MKKTLMAGCLILLVSLVQAQQKTGKVVYERVSQMQARFNINGVDNIVPQSRKDNFELTFGNNQSLWNSAEQENDEATTVSDNGGMQMHMIVAGSNDVLYCNFETGKRTEKREFLDKTFIVDDSISSLKWKMTS